MKKFVKVCLILGIILSVVGVGVTSASVAMGATLSDTILYSENGSRIDHTIKAAVGETWQGLIHDDLEGFDYDYDHDYDDKYDYDHDYSDQNQAVNLPELTDSNQVLSFDNVRKLDINLKAGGLRIEENSSITQVKVVCNRGLERVRATMEGDELKIESRFSGNWLSTGNDDRLIVVYVPTGSRFAKVELDVKAGGIESAHLAADELDIDVKAGGVSIKGEVGNLDLSSGTGGIEFKGTVTGEIDAESQIGGITLNLIGRQTDYNYELKCKLGTIKLGGSSYTGLSGSKRINNNASRMMELDCNTGGIEVTFQDNL